ncbi:type I pullulanase [uncultured Ruminococcus sp.]|uniref:type I pullulanase n=1 Tax=uncultured Ruminococcus sp. TaxID=165186 RepID=UPI00292E299B|nr:type I pullulanase [uncultured Ruminococcus sp.]
MATTAFYSNKDEIYNTYLGSDLGFTYTPESTTFKVWAPSAEQVLLKLYSTGSFYEEGAQVLGIKQMLFDAVTGVWSATIDGDLNRTYYTYVIKTENGTHETQDVYSKAVGVNSQRSEVVDLASTNPEGWENDRHVLPDRQTDAIVWEIHVRDFSSSDTSGVSREHRGKFLAFTEKNTVIPYTNFPTCVNYLKQLGITHVQLNPVFDFGSVNETTGVEYNWGYDPVNYNVPEGSYSTDPYHGEVRIREFKEMVKALHDEGIGVIMDVVYNHVYSTQYSPFERTVPGYYFRMQNGKFLNSSGCGNVTATDKVMFRRFMVDSLRYWAEEYHIDGFRFDLMACHDIDTMNEIRSELDKIDKRILMYGEPWTANDGENGISGEDCCNKANAKKLSGRIGMFNDDMRHGIKGGSDDDSKGFIQGSTHSAYNVIAGMMGASSVTFGNWANEPSQCVTYVSAHDNLTLWDKILKSNWCDDFDTTDNLYISQNKLAAVLVLGSLGISFVLAGEEFARTKHGDHNSYKSPDSVNSINWTRAVRYKELMEYYKGLIKIRKSFSPIRDNTTKAVNDGYIVYNGQSISLTVKNDNENEWKMMSVIINNSDHACVPQFKSQYDLPSGWYVIADAETAGDKAIRKFDPCANIPPRSALIIVDAESYEKINGVPTFEEPVKEIGLNISREIKEIIR